MNTRKCLLPAHDVLLACFVRINALDIFASSFVQKELFEIRISEDEENPGAVESKLYQLYYACV